MPAFYTATVGAAELNFYDTSDSHARRVVARWVRMFFARFAASRPAGSIAFAICNGWDGVDVTATLYRRSIDDIGVISGDVVRVDAWNIEHNSEIR